MTDATHIDSWYSRTLAEDTPSYESLTGAQTADVCVIGGGMAGVATALGLAERGVSCILLEGRRIGWGASGRNGGFLSPGYALGVADLIRKVGLSHAKELFRLTQDALALIENRIADYNIPCGPVVSGKVHMSMYRNDRGLERHAELMNSEFGENFEVWTKDKLQTHYLTDAYHHAAFASSPRHLHALNLTAGTAKAAAAKGCRVFEATPATELTRSGSGYRVSTPQGSVQADQVILAGSGYGKNMPARLTAATVPVATYVMVTQPLEDRLATVIRAPYAVSDNRVGCDYYRPLPDSGGRLLWGGRISAFHLSPQKVAEAMYRDMLRIYPQLDGVQADVSWTGTMGYTRHKMPIVGQLEPGLWSCTNFGGHGMVATTAGGEVIAKAIAEGDETYRLFEPFQPVYAGWPMGPLAAQIVYWRHQLAEEMRIRF